MPLEHSFNPRPRSAVISIITAATTLLRWSRNFKLALYPIKNSNLGVDRNIFGGGNGSYVAWETIVYSGAIKYLLSESKNLLLRGKLGQTAIWKKISQPRILGSIFNQPRILWGIQGRILGAVFERVYGWFAGVHSLAPALCICIPCDCHESQRCLPLLKPARQHPLDCSAKNARKEL